VKLPQFAPAPGTALSGNYREGAFAAAHVAPLPALRMMRLGMDLYQILSWKSAQCDAAPR
jgi:hypothetical protein